MDPVSLFSILIKISTINIDKNKDLSYQELTKKSRTEIIDLYRSAMTKKKYNFSKFN